MASILSLLLSQFVSCIVPPARHQPFIVRLLSSNHVLLFPIWVFGVMMCLCRMSFSATTTVVMEGAMVFSQATAVQPQLPPYVFDFPSSGNILFYYRNQRFNALKSTWRVFPFGVLPHPPETFQVGRGLLPQKRFSLPNQARLTSVLCPPLIYPPGLIG